MKSGNAFASKWAELAWSNGLNAIPTNPGTVRGTIPKPAKVRPFSRRRIKSATSTRKSIETMRALVSTASLKSSRPIEDEFENDDQGEGKGPREASFRFCACIRTMKGGRRLGRALTSNGRKLGLDGVSPHPFRERISRNQDSRVETPEPR